MNALRFLVDLPFHNEAVAKVDFVGGEICGISFLALMHCTSERESHQRGETKQKWTNGHYFEHVFLDNTHCEPSPWYSNVLQLFAASRRHKEPSKNTNNLELAKKVAASGSKTVKSRLNGFCFFLVV